jgi:hypothetical protein
MRLERLALLHPGLERVERPQPRIEAERQRRPLRVGGGVAEDAEAAREALDVVEQHSRAVWQSGGDLGDAADLVHGIGAVDPPQRVELVDEPDEFAQILVHPHSPLNATAGRSTL